MIDPFSGESKFDSKRAGINEIKDQMIMYSSNAILVSGRTFNNKDILILSSPLIVDQESVIVTEDSELIPGSIHSCARRS